MSAEDLAPVLATWGGIRTTSRAELLEWHTLATGDMPDADISVICWVHGANGGEWFAGWWDGERWIDAAHGGPMTGTVTHWAEPEGPPA